MNNVRERERMEFRQDVYGNPYSDAAYQTPNHAYDESMRPRADYAEYRNNAAPQEYAPYDAYRSQQPQMQQSFMPDYYAQECVNPNMQMQQSGQARYEEVGHYAPTTHYAGQVHYTQNAKTKKTKLNTKSKMLIAVYFFIVLVIATMLLVNGATANAQRVSAEDNEAKYNPDAVTYTVDVDGNAVEMEQLAPVVDYSYETETNWFDRMCDKLTDLFG